MKVPCIAMIGSCVYEDVCELMSLITTCPPQLVAIGFTCSCPIEQVSLNRSKKDSKDQESIQSNTTPVLIGHIQFNNLENRNCKK